MPERPTRALRTRPAVVVSGAVIALAAVGGLVEWFVDGDALAPPAPVVSDDGEWVPELPPSTLQIPVVYDLRPIVDKLEAVIPPRFGSLEDRKQIDDNENASAAFQISRSPFSARLEGDTAYVSATVHYQGRIWYDPPLLPELSASCGTGEEDPSPRARIGLSAVLSLAPDWSLTSQPRVERVLPATDTERDRCEVTFLDIDVTGRVMDAARGILVDSLPAIQRELAGIDLREKFEGWWNTISAPVELGEDIWLVLDPKEVHRGEISGEGLTLTARVGLIAHPRIVLGPRPTLEVPPLPPLDSAAIEPGLHVRAAANGDYEVGSERLTEALRGLTVEESGRLLRIQSVRVSGVGGGSLAMEVTVDGAVGGRLYLVGKPEYDRRTREIFVPELDFDVATRALLVDGLAWIAGTAFVSNLRERARWPVEDLVAFATEQLNRGLNAELGDEARLRGSVDSVSVLGVYPTRDALVVHASARADAMLLVEEAGDSVSDRPNP